MSEMIISGIQKLTLLDFPGQVACTLFTKGCNMRCPFCHNASLVTRAAEQPIYDNAEILSFLKKRAGILDGVAITGGEPTLMSGLADFLYSVRELGYKIKLDSNGLRPDVLRRLIDEELVDYIAMDIKNCREKYAQTAGLGENFDIAPIEESAALLMEGRVDFEFRTTVVHPLHSTEDFERIGEWLAGDEKFFLQQFKDSGDLIGSGLSAPGAEKMTEYFNVLKPFVRYAQLRGV